MTEKNYSSPFHRVTNERISFLLPDLIEIQRKSFYDFLETGIIEEFSKINPVLLNSGEICVVFYPKEYQFTSPPFSIREAILHGKTYSAKLYVPAQICCKRIDFLSQSSSSKLKKKKSVSKQKTPEFSFNEKAKKVVKKRGEKGQIFSNEEINQKEALRKKSLSTYQTLNFENWDWQNLNQEPQLQIWSLKCWVLLGNLPLMTKRGHFVINGSPRVIVSQMIRCPGVYFHERFRGIGIQKKRTCYVDFISRRGAWLRIQSDKNRDIWIRLKRTPRIPLDTFQEGFKSFERYGKFEANTNWLEKSKKDKNSFNTFSSSKENSFEKKENQRGGSMATPSKAALRVKRGGHRAPSYFPPYAKRRGEERSRASTDARGGKKIQNTNDFDSKKISLDFGTSRHLNLLSNLQLQEKRPLSIFQSSNFEMNNESWTSKQINKFSEISNIEIRRIENSLIFQINNLKRTTGQKNLLSTVEVQKRKITKKNFYHASQSFHTPYKNSYDRSRFSELFDEVQENGTKLDQSGSYNFENGKGEDLAAAGGLQFIFQKFKNPRTYDLGKLGRARINQKLNIYTLNRQLNSKDIEFACSYLKRIEKNQILPDDIDNLKNRRVRAAGELLQAQLETGLYRLERFILSRLKPTLDTVRSPEWNSLLTKENHSSLVRKPLLPSVSREGKRIENSRGSMATPSYFLQGEKRGRASTDARGGKVQLKKNQHNKLFKRKKKPIGLLTGLLRSLITTKAINGAFREFFGSNPLSQYMDQTNPLAEVTHKRRLSSLGPGGISRDTAGMAIRGIHSTHYGRICPIETPEGKNAGLVNSLTVFAQGTQTGFLKTPYYKVYKGQVQKNSFPFFFSANSEQEMGITIAPGDLDLSSSHFLPPFSLPARIAGTFEDPFKRVKREKINYIALSPLQMISIATSLIPFLEHDDANRALMGSNMQRQAVPLLKPERPIVGTGLESLVVAESGQTVESQKRGLVLYSSSEKILLHKLPTRGGSWACALLPLSSFFVPYNFCFPPSPLPFAQSEGKAKRKGVRWLPIHTSLLTPSEEGRSKRSKAVHLAMREGDTQRVASSSSFGELHERKETKVSFCLSTRSEKGEFSILSVQFLKRFKFKKGSHGLIFKSLVPPFRKIGTNPQRGLQKVRILGFSSKFLFATTYPLYTYQRSNQETSMSHRPAVKEGDWVQKGDLLADCSASSKGELALGKNILIAYLPWEGFNFEDAVVASERLASEDLYTSVHVEKHEIEIRESRLALEEITPHIPHITKKQKESLDSTGLIKIGRWVNQGDILVAKTTAIKPKPLSPHQKLAFDLARLKPSKTKDTSLRVPKGVHGRVIRVEILETTSVPLHLENRKTINSANSSFKLFSLDESFEHNGDGKIQHQKKISSAKRNIHKIICESFKENIWKRKKKKILFFFSNHKDSWKKENFLSFNSFSLIQSLFFNGSLGTEKKALKKIQNILKFQYGEQKKICLPILLESKEVFFFKNGLKKAFLSEDKKKENIFPSGYFFFPLPSYANREGVQWPPPRKPGAAIEPLLFSFLPARGGQRGSMATPLYFPQGDERGRASSPLRENARGREGYRQQKEEDFNSGKKLFFCLMPNISEHWDFRKWICKNLICKNVASLARSKSIFNFFLVSQYLRNKAILRSSRVLTYIPSGGYKQQKKRKISKFRIYWKCSATLLFKIGLLQTTYSISPRYKRIMKNWNSHFELIKNKELLFLEKLGQKDFQKTRLLDPLLFSKRGKTGGSTATYAERVYARGSTLINSKEENFLIHNQKTKSSISSVGSPSISERSKKQKQTPVSKLGIPSLKQNLSSTRRSKIFPTRVRIYLAEKRKIQVGDKVAGRHGNKGIISVVLPRIDMPYLPDGRIVDMILNPLGVPSRMNVGQVFECLLGLAGVSLNQHYRIPAFDEMYGPEASRSLVYLKLYQARLRSGQHWLFHPTSPGKTRLTDGRTGEPFDQLVTTGTAYIIKLVHLVDDKIHARSTGPYSLVTKQPLGGRSKHGGQRLGEMEVWALEGFGAAYTLQEMLTSKSDDVLGRQEVLKGILSKKTSPLGNPEAFKVLVRELQSLCLDIRVSVLRGSPMRRERVDISEIK
jgi:DNA-directed RNA polymerase beta subunit